MLALDLSDSELLFSLIVRQSVSSVSHPVLGAEIVVSSNRLSRNELWPDGIAADNVGRKPANRDRSGIAVSR